VITGAASGIGLGLALRAAREGMNVALVDVEEGPLRSALKQVRAIGARAIGVHTDVSDAEAVAALADRVDRDLGAAWLVCNNAGVNKFKPVWSLTAADWHWIVGVNLGGVINGIASFVPGMIARGGGHVVNTASAAAFTVTPGAGAYSATKHAVVGLSEALYRELAIVGSAVGVTVVCPRLVATNMLTSERNEPGATGSCPEPVDMMAFDTPGMRVLSSEELADQVFAAVRERRFWVLPHVDEMGGIAQARLAQAIEGKNPDDASVDARSVANGARQSGLVDHARRVGDVRGGVS
jgi:NAD(P)-dependent dehydrogenase (short-subunit alcohol dehydrogenase family)